MAAFRIGSSLALFLALVATGPASPVRAQETLVAPEKNPPGDIPDNQAFVTYVAKSSFSLKVPEGWSRAPIEGGVRFFDKYDVIEVKLGSADPAATPAAAKDSAAAELLKNGHGAKITAVKETKLAAGAALHISYLANSEPNAVTGKQLRLEHERYVLVKDGRTVTLDLAAPAGADNVDQWQLISNSLHWQ